MLSMLTAKKSHVGILVDYLPSDGSMTVITVHFHYLLIIQLFYQFIYLLFGLNVRKKTGEKNDCYDLPESKITAKC